MKGKLFIFLAGAMILCASAGIAGCNQTQPEPAEPDQSLQYGFERLYTNGELRDIENGFATISDITSARYFVNGEYADTFTSSNIRQDIKMEFQNGTNTRFVNVSGGFTFTLPTTDYTVDYSIAKYQTRFTFGDITLEASMNSENPYLQSSNPWYIYNGEWLIRHINSDSYMSKNGLERINGTSSYEFTETHNFGDLMTKEGYDYYRYDVCIKDAEEIAEPYYHVAILRKADDAKNFTLLVLKSKTNQKEMMDSLVESFRIIAIKGVEKNYFSAGTPELDPNWSSETANYYQSLISSSSVNWGVFSYSMPGGVLQVNPDNPVYIDHLAKSKSMKEGIEAAWDYSYDIYPTYTHLEGYFPLAMARELAGGNGTNGKPVLQYTYQFTTDNNYVLSSLTPMFDILRGKYDSHFRRLASDIKAYEQPVLFRLNNEMNTDWTSYCGMLTLLDPDIFNLTWQRLYDIFTEEGVDNCIWIWNPVATSCPYSSWGEDLCYFPGVEYVHLLGGTYYEMNNYDAETAADEIVSFKTGYSDLYQKNLPVFGEWKMIISEFACGSGGETSGALGRNGAVQANWVKEMFDAFTADDMEPWAKSIIGAIWFNCNDYDEQGNITNRLRFFDPDSNDYDDLSATVQAFREGFSIVKSKKQ